MKSDTVTISKAEYEKMKAFMKEQEKMRALEAKADARRKKEDDEFRQRERFSGKLEKTYNKINNASFDLSDLAEEFSYDPAETSKELENHLKFFSNQNEKISAKTKLLIALVEELRVKHAEMIREETK